MIEADLPRVGGILLAAGGSNRMGRPKQLIEFEGATLIQRTAESLKGSGCDPCIVVLGSNANDCVTELSGIGIDICINEAWASGMSSSIKAGLMRLLEAEPDLSAVMITLADQPYVTAAIIGKFVAEYRRIRPTMIASEYNGITGVPALFSREMFDRILKLKGDRGARALIEAAGDNVIRFSVPEAAFDVDSPADLVSVGETGP